MKTQEIEIFEIEKLNNGYEVSYDFEGNDVKLLIQNESLYLFIIDKGLNEYCVDAELGDYASDSPIDVLHDDYYSIVSQYLNDLHKC